jgi:hypothetical protein
VKASETKPSTSIRAKAFLPCAAALILFGAGNPALGIIFSSPDAAAYLVNKTLNYVQSVDGTITPRATVGYTFFASILDTPPGRINDAGTSLSVPQGGQYAFTRVGINSDVLSITATFNTPETFEAAFPNGDYLFNVDIISGNDVVASIGLPTGVDPYPSPPTVTNYTNSQFDDLSAIEPTDPFTLHWNTFTTSGGPATGTDYILVAIEDPDTPDLDTVFLSPGPTAEDRLDGTSTEITVPSNTLLPGKAYQARVVFVQIVNTNFFSWFGVFGISSYGAQTEFTLTTVSPDLTFDVWIDSLGSDPGASTADPDGDGLSNFMEYALGLDPFSKDLNQEQAASPTLSDNSDKLIVQSRRIAGATDVSYFWETTPDFKQWVPASPVINVITTTDDPIPVEIIEVCFPLTGNSDLFTRLRVAPEAGQ